jgi:hypothetical protein
VGILRQNWWGRRTDETESRELRLRRGFVVKRTEWSLVGKLRVDNRVAKFGPDSMSVLGTSERVVVRCASYTLLPKVTLEMDEVRFGWD